MTADARFAAAIRDLEDIELDRHPVLRFMRRARELRANVTPHDTTYVALAEVLRCELLAVSIARLWWRWTTWLLF